MCIYNTHCYMLSSNTKFKVSPANCFVCLFVKYKLKVLDTLFNIDDIVTHILKTWLRSLQLTFIEILGILIQRSLSMPFYAKYTLCKISFFLNSNVVWFCDLNVVYWLEIIKSWNTFAFYCNTLNYSLYRKVLHSCRYNYLLGV